MRTPGGNAITEEVKRDEFNAGGVEITRVDISGTYLFSPTPMSPQTTPKPNYRMIAAIARAPEGNVFFKLTAPEQTAQAATLELEAMLKSVRTSP